MTPLNNLQRFFLILIFVANLCLLLPPLRFIGSLGLICFLPGYFLGERLSLWKNPLFAAIGAVGISVLLSPLITLPGCILLHRVNSFIIAVSLDLFLLGLLFSFKRKERRYYQEDTHHPLLAPLLILIGSWIFIYMDITKLGPYSEDWAYLFGIIKELSRNMPPQDPEASSLLLRYPWGFYFFYAMIHRLGGISAWEVLEFIPVLISFSYLGMVYMLLFQSTKNQTVGLWAIILLAVGKQSEWVIRGFQGLGWHPGFSFNLHWEEAQVLTGYSLLWGWYILPSLLPPLTAFFFLIRYQQEKQKKDLWLSLGACSIGPFFHPIFYIGFMAGFSVILFFLWLKKKFNPWLFFYFATFIPYFLTFYLYIQPGTPDIPIYELFLDKRSIINALWDYLRVNGIVIPFALLALFVSSEARLWFLPFAGLFALLCILGKGVVNHTAHFLFQNGLYLSLISAIGLGSLKKIPSWARTLVYLAVLTIIVPPFIFQVSDRVKVGWEGVIDIESKAAGEFIRTHTEPNSTFLILPDSRYSMICVEGIGERKLIFGWFYHLNRYENRDFLQNLRQNVQQFFSISDPQKKKAILQQYRPDYLFLGPDEIIYMRQYETDIKRLALDLQTVYKSENIEIFKVDQGKPS